MQEIMLSADNIANIRESGIVVHGAHPAGVLPLVTPTEVRAAVLEMLHEGPGHCETEQEAAVEVLNLVRSLCALDNGRPTTRSQGVAWSLIHLDEHWHEVVRRADEIRHGASIPQDDARMRTALPAMNRALRPHYSEANEPPAPPPDD
jgi:hypothetical protein